MRLIVYTDEKTHELSQWVTRVSLTRSTLEPYESANVDLLIPFDLMFEIFPSVSTGAQDLDLWILLFAPFPGQQRERAQFIGRVTGIISGARALSQEMGEGMLKTQTLSLSCESWLQPARGGQIYLSGKSPIKGHVLNVNTAGARFQALSDLPFKTRNVGAILSPFWREYAQFYRLPKTLLGGPTLAAWSSVAATQESAKTFTPSRAVYHRDVFGLALNVSGGVMRSGSTAWGSVRSAFQGDPNVIELFTSLEPTEDQNSESNKVLGVRPVIIYRIKPFLSKENQDSLMSPQANAVDLENIFSVDLNVQDADRINAVYIDSPLTPSQGVELFGTAADPVLKLDDIDKTGLRLYRGVWPFFPSGKKKKISGGLQAELQEVVDLVSSIVMDRHRFFNGTIQAAQNLSLRAGEWVALSVGARSLYAYISTVTHTSHITDKGVLIQRSRIEFMRGFFE